MLNILRLFEERLMEADDYKPMFEPLERYLLNLNSGINGLFHIGSTIDEAKKYVAAQRKDKQMWCSRILRAYLAGALTELLTHSDNIEEATVVKGLFDKYQQQSGPLLRVVGNMNTTSFLVAVCNFISAMEHYDGINYGKIKNFSYNSTMSEEQVFDVFREFEEDYIERAQGRLTMKDGDQIILKMAPYYWIMLDRASCPEEAKAMGHCGNSPAAGSKQRIVSLRLLKDTIDGVQYFEPCLTFILHPDGYLGEMKGKGNLKPAEHYHDQIEALLHLPVIKGIRGGGYLPQNNFALKDFGDDRARASLDQKPELAPLADQYALLGLSPKFEKTLVDGFMLTGKRFWQEQGFSPNSMVEEDKDKLYRDNPILMPPGEYYKKLGMDDTFEALLANNFNWQNGERAVEKFKREELFSLDMLSDEDRNKLFDDHPEVMTIKNRYDRFGLTDEMMEEINRGIEEWGNNSYARGQDWYNRKNTSTEGFTAREMSEEDRHRLWRKYPITATVADLYEMDGLTPGLMKDIANGYAERGLTYYENIEFSPSDMKPEDQEHLAREHPECAPAEVSFRIMGATEEWAKVMEAKAHAGNTAGVGFSLIWEQDKDKFSFERWKTVYALIEEYGDSTLKQYGTEDYDSDYYDSDDSGYLNDFDDYLPIEVQKKLYEIAAGYIDEDEDEVNSWSDVIRILEDNDDPNYEAMKSGCRSGERSGAEAEVYDAVREAIDGIELSHGDIEFKTFKTRDDEDATDMHEPCEWVMKPEEMAKFIDGESFRDAENGNLKDVLKGEEIEMSEPYYGFGGFDESAAYDTFTEECDLPDDIFTENPYPEAKLAKMSDEKLRAAINDLYDKCEGFSRRPNGIDEKSTDDLRSTLAYIAKKFYSKAAK